VLRPFGEDVLEQLPRIAATYNVNRHVRPASKIHADDTPVPLVDAASI
jgi:hypothetical protein